MGQRPAKTAKKEKITDLLDVSRKRAWGRLLAATAIFGGQVIYSVAQESYILPKNPSWSNIALAIFLSVVCILALEGIYFGLLKLSNTWKLKQTKLSWNDFVTCLLGLILVLLVQLACADLAHGQTSNNQAALDKLIKHSGKLIYLMFCILAPICEELIYRGFFFQILQLKNGKFEKALGVVLSALAFALVHDQQTDIFFLAYFLMGSVLAGVYAITENLTASMTVHALNNTLAVIISGI